MVTMVCLVLFALKADMFAIYWMAVVLAGSILAWEQSLVREGDLSRVNLAFFTLNGWIGVLLFAGCWLDMGLLGGGRGI